MADLADTPQVWGGAGALDIVENTDADSKARPDPKSKDRMLPALPFRLISRSGESLKRYRDAEEAASGAAAIASNKSPFSKLRSETAERFIADMTAAAKVANQSPQEYAAAVLASGIVTLYPVARSTKGSSKARKSQPSALGRLFAKR